MSEDVNPFGGGNPGFHDDHYDNPLLTKETELEPIIWDIGDEEEEYTFVNKYQKESMPVYDTDIKDVIKEEEGFVGKGGIGEEEDNIEDDVVVANDICSSMIQTTLYVDVEEDINTKSHELMLFGKSIIIKQSSITEFVYLIEAHHHLNPIFIPKDNSPGRLDDGVVMLVLEARGRPLRFGEVYLSPVALNPKLEVFYALSYNQLSGPLVGGRSENLLVFRWEVVQVTLKV
nr:hypothetical protein [Tanacetum cinerariifolium]